MAGLHATHADVFIRSSFDAGRRAPNEVFRMEDYGTFLEAHPDEWGALDALCRITISRFDRDRAVFDALRDPILPELGRAALARRGAAVRAWSAGCASGEEPYTLSLAWALDAVRRAPDVELEIVATEVDARLLERARVGCYPPGALKELPSEWVDAAFDRVGDTLCIGPAFSRTPFSGESCSDCPRAAFWSWERTTLPPRDRPLVRPYDGLPILQVESRPSDSVEAPS